MKRTLLLLLLSITLLHSLHIYEDTVWDRRGNPYIFEENVYVHEGATLTILPGCEIHIKAMPSWVNGNFWCGTNNEAQAKRFHVSGKIVAVGTEDDPISFLRYPDTEAYAWGGVFVDEDAETPIFQHCVFLGVYRNVFSDWTVTCGAVCSKNGDFRIEHCTFTNCQTGIYSCYIQNDTMIYGCIFEATEEAQFSDDSRYLGIIATGSSDNDVMPQLIVARNRFINISFPFGSGSYQGGGLTNQWAYNYHANFEDYDIVLEDDRRQRNQPYKSVYGSVFINWSESGGGGESDNMSCFRKNYIYDTSSGNPMTTYSVNSHVISDNIFYGNVDIDDRFADSTIVCNNVVYVSTDWAFYEPENPFHVYNNLFTGYPKLRACHPGILHNNTLLSRHNNSCLAALDYDFDVYNNILCAIDEIMSAGGPATVLSYNFMNHPFPAFATDGGGNIFGDDPMFADTLNGDYSLAEGSPCIDAGMPDGDYPPTDILGNVRVWDGDGDGTATIDIGAFEYGAPFWGGIEGYVYEEDGETPLDIAKITVDGVQFPEWSDSTGWFRILTGPGTFTLNIERMYYDDQQVTGIVVEQGSPTYRNITMQSLEAHDYDNLIQQYTITMEQNTPNPFNPTTTIAYSIPKDDKVELKVYNIKGQLVKTLVNDHLEAGTHKAVWNGDNKYGKSVSSGIYLYRLESCGKTKAQKMLLLK